MRTVRLFPNACMDTKVFLLSILKANDVHLLLDVGCGGEGIYCLPALNKGVMVVGVDVSKEAVVRAHNKLHKYDSFHMVVADAQELPFIPDKFDFILCSETIEHLYRPREFLRQSYLLLRSKGKIMITTPNKAGLFMLASSLRKKLTVMQLISSVQPFAVEEHVSAYTWNNLLKTLVFEGFQLEYAPVFRGFGFADLLLNVFTNILPVQNQAVFDGLNILRVMEEKIGAFLPFEFHSGWVAVCAKVSNKAI